MPQGLLVCLLIIGLSASVAAAELPAPLAQALKRYGLSAHGLSLYVHEIGRRDPALAFAADAPRNPASTIKILTTLAALEELTPAYQWKTEAYATGPLEDGRLEGDLYLKGYGDPFLVIEHFWRFLRALRQLGVEVIAGDLVLDQSHFVPPPGDPADFDSRPHRAYNVLPAALLVNFQTVGLRFVPAPAEKRVYVIADPLPAHVTVENRLRLTQRGCRGWAHRPGMQVAGRPASERIVLTGEYDAGCGENEIFRVVSEPAAYIHGVFRALWTELGGRLEGAVREGVTPGDARLLHTAHSPPLADIVRAVNKFSNNVMTRQLLLTLGAERFGLPGTEEKGVTALHA
jgi:D-alanyl-D-alanine carboxypeptidase/D-alanyl-D-alanine-endopeptidase (penicillin-binding protein 4)